MAIVRILGAVCVAIISPVLLAGVLIALLAADLCFAAFGKRKNAYNIVPRFRSASVVIPNWNGRDLLEKFLPSVIAALRSNPQNEIIVVDNASTDGSADFVRQTFPGVRVLRQERNLGFGGGSNAGFLAARNDIVVLLNNDMRVEPGFLMPLLRPFTDPLVFSVSCQIFFSDPAKRREETGLTETWWEQGRLRVSHRVDPKVNRAYPCAYPGGGSSAFDRGKFLQLGGFDELFRPFYYEDTALGHMAWKRGWKVLYEPRSVVFHEHRGTIGKNFSTDFIQEVIQKNALLYIWKNIHDWRMLLPHFWASSLTAFGGTMAGNPKGRHAAFGVLKAASSLREAMSARWKARELSQTSDGEAFRRQRGGYYRDRFGTGSTQSERLQVLFASPYPIEPPVHGGAVFMKQTLEALHELADVHLVSFVDDAGQLSAQESLRPLCASAEFLVREGKSRGSLADLLPQAVHEFRDRDFGWAIDRTIFLKKIDVVQIEYTVLAQYAGKYKHLPVFLFEHDIAFQSLARTLKTRWSARQFAAYMQLLRYETNAVKRFTRVQVCSPENADFLLSYVPELEGRVDAHLRAAIDTSQYKYVEAPRLANTILFVGSVRHAPNLEALTWFVDSVFPLVVALHPEARLMVAGAGSWEVLANKLDHPNIELLGFVSDIRELFQQYSVFVCPILSGSGVRVKLLEAFASGIPVVSTTLGAEGLTNRSTDICELADDPDSFAGAVVHLLQDESYAQGLAKRAHEMVVNHMDAKQLTTQLVEVYRTEVARVAVEATDPATPETVQPPSVASGRRSVRI